MADWSDLTFNASDTDYISQLDTLRDRSEANATEVEDARQGELTLDVLTGNLKTEVEAAREGEISLLVNLGNYIKNGALTSSFDLNGQKITNIADGVAGTDLTNLSQATALILGGASPTDINITDISVGTANNGQRFVSNGTNPVGEDNDLLTLDVGALGANQVAVNNTGGTALVAGGLEDIDSGSLSSDTPVKVNVGGTGLDEYDNDLELSASAEYAYDNFG